MAGQSSSEGVSYALDQADGHWAIFISQDGDRFWLRKGEYNKLDAPRELVISVTKKQARRPAAVQPQEEEKQ